MSQVHAFNLIQSVSDYGVQRTKNGKGHRSQRRAASGVYVAGGYLGTGEKNGVDDEEGERRAALLKWPSA
jgi:hypothetical protein